MENNESSPTADSRWRSLPANLSDSLSSWKSKNMQQPSNWKNWIPLLAFMAQGIGVLWYVAQTTERTVLAVQHLQQQVSELKTSNQLLANAITDIAVLKVKVATIENERYQGDRRASR
jgi:hypothetical protein